MAVPISSIGTYRWLFRAIQSLHQRQFFVIDWIWLLQFSSTLNSGHKWWSLWRSISFSRLGWRSRSLSLLLSLSSSLTGFLLTGVGYLMLIVLWLMVLEMVFMLRTRSPFSPSITCGCNVFSVGIVCVCSCILLIDVRLDIWMWVRFAIGFDWVVSCITCLSSCFSLWWKIRFWRRFVFIYWKILLVLEITAQSTVFWFVTLYYVCSC